MKIQYSKGLSSAKVKNKVKTSKVKNKIACSHLVESGRGLRFSGNNNPIVWQSALRRLVSVVPV